MRNRPSVRRRAAAFVASAALALSDTSCADSSDDSEPDATNEDTTSQAEPQEPESSDGDADVPLSEAVTVDGDAPMWALPVVSGWSSPAEGASGVFQIAKDDSDTLVTAYQLKSDDAENDRGDEEGGRNWLENYHAQIVANPQASDVSDPAYSTTVLDTTLGAMEFVSQQLQYSTAEGDRYTSFYAARTIEGNLFAVQYAALEDEWSQDEWAEIRERGLQLAF